MICQNIKQKGTKIYFLEPMTFELLEQLYKERTKQAITESHFIKNVIKSVVVFFITIKAFATFKCRLRQ